MFLSDNLQSFFWSSDNPPRILSVNQLGIAVTKLGLWNPSNEFFDENANSSKSKW